ncbi:MAG TPA: hypothetical protein ENI58_03150 [Nitrospirae bacterium]|nr:hypothetical protein [Nitrospirota bacterium]
MGILEKIASFLNGKTEEPVPGLGRNDTCWCGSGKKHKRCHLEEDDKKRAAQRTAACKTS